MLDRFLVGVNDTARTPLVIALWCTTWGAGLAAVIIGWQAGLIWLTLGAVGCHLGRKAASPNRGLAPIDPPEADAATSGTAEERVMARLADMTPASESADA